MHDDCERCKIVVRKALSDARKTLSINDPIFYAETMMQRYLPGFDASQVTDEEFIRKYGMMLYVLECEGKKLPDIKAGN